MKTISIIVLAFLSVATANSTSAKFVGANLAVTPDQEKQPERIKIGKLELPAEAKKTLEGSDFRGWTLVAAYRTKEGEYEVEIKRGETTQVIKFDREGRMK